MLECHYLKFGLSPSLLGMNGEVLATNQQISGLLIFNSELLMANLSDGAHIELLLVNTSEHSVTVSWRTEQEPALIWSNSQGEQVISSTLNVNSRDWLIGVN